MVPPDYYPYFSTMAAVGATLFGLIFVAISIVPESVAASSAPLERQVKATTAYIALLNPLIISLSALVPKQHIGSEVIFMSGVGLINTLIMALAMLQTARQSRARFGFFILGGFFLYGYETYFAVRLLQSPTDTTWLNILADFLIVISVFGVIRAWELIGIRQFHLRDWLSSLETTKKKENR